VHTSCDAIEEKKWRLNDFIFLQSSWSFIQASWKAYRSIPAQLLVHWAIYLFSISNPKVYELFSKKEASEEKLKDE
jgi:hypothetical protein